MSQQREPWGRSGRLILVVALLAGAALRLYDLGGASFADDEVYKVNAVALYRAGHYVLTRDDEHPMFMKLLIWGSTVAAERWNALAPAHVINLEAATRLPNALAGALLCLVLAWLGRALFSRRVGLLAALLCATEVNLIGFARIAKEDTLVGLFLAWAFYLALAAKQSAERDDGAAARRYENGTAVALALLCASKYFLHVAAAVPLFYAWSRRAGSPWFISRRRWLALAALGAGVFLALNPTVLSPSNLRYNAGFIGHKTIYSHGYYFLGRLFLNEVFAGATRTPWYFYFVFLIVKLPLPTLGAAAAGVGRLAAERRSDGARLLASWGGVWLLVHAFLAGGRFTRYLAHFLPVMVLLAAVGVDTAAHELVALGSRRRGRDATAWPWAALAALVLGSATLAAVRSAPNYRMYLNAAAGGPQRVRYFFPHCDLYDIGMREAVQWACARAAPGAQFRSDAKVAVAHYVERLCHRPDILTTALSEPGSGCRPERACFQFPQVGRTYFETAALFDRLHAERPPDHVEWVDGVDVAEVYGPP